MNISAYLIAVGLVLGSGQAAASCIRPDRPVGISSQKISLLKAAPDGSFYYHSMDFGYTILVPQRSLLSSLSERSDLRAMIKTSEPLRSRVDLLEYVFIDAFVAGEIQAILASLLERGDAAVFHSGTGTFEPSVTLEHLNSERGRSRTFRIMNSLVFFQSDCVVD